MGDPTARQSASQVIRARWNGVHFEFVAGVNLQIDNLSPEPALNVKVIANLDALGLSAESMLGLPVNAGESEYVELRIAGRDSAQSIAFAHALKPEATLDIEVHYESLEGLVWVSTVQYGLTAASANIDGALDKSNPDYIESDDSTAGGGPTNQTYFELVPRANTWHQYEKVTP